MIQGVNFKGNQNPLFFIIGPCVIENEAVTAKIAQYAVGLARKLKVTIIFKASYDKANRSSISSFRGIGISKGLDILKKIKKKYNIPITTDVHSCDEVEKAAEMCDIIQIPAFLCRQTDLLVEAGKSQKIINIKKGQFMAPEDMIHAVKKVMSTGNNNILLTERGYSFGYHNLVVDMRSLEIMKGFGFPVIFDATHAVQLPGGQGNTSGGDRRFILPLARAAAAVGIAGLFFETHPRPEKALSDGSNSIPLNKLETTIKNLVRIDNLVKKMKL